METAEIIAFSAGLVGVLVGVSLATIAIIWQIRSQSDRVDAMGNRVDAMGDRVDGVSGRVDGMSGRIDGLSSRIDGLNDKIDAMGERLSAEIRDMRAEIRAQGGEITEARLEQARIEGANQILRRQSHTHPPHNPPIDQEAAAD